MHKPHMSNRIGLLLKDQSNPVPMYRKSCLYVVKPITDLIISAVLKMQQEFHLPGTLNILPQLQ